MGVERRMMGRERGEGKGGKVKGRRGGGWW